MAIEDKLQPPPISPKSFPPFSPEDEKKAQKELDRLRKNKKRGFEGKTLWDWLQLLGVPIFLACATIGFSFVQFYLADQQHQHDQVLADQQHASDQRIANQQHAADQHNALEQQHATTLQTYIDNIQELLLKDNLQGAKSDSEVAILARARTLTALQGLDPDRKGRLVQFLYETQLIGFAEYTQFFDKLKLQHNRIIDLSFANLRGANLRRADLNRPNLLETFTSFANLSGADSILIIDHLLDVDLFGTNLSGVDLSDADLSDANLLGADLKFANLSNADLGFAKLSNAELGFAKLSNADLVGTNLSNAELGFADLSNTDLRLANLSNTDLSNTDLTQQQLDQVFSCTGAILPQGLLCHN